MPPHFIVTHFTRALDNHIITTIAYLAMLASAISTAAPHGVHQSLIHAFRKPQVTTIGTRLVELVQK